MAKELPQIGDLGTGLPNLSIHVINNDVASLDSEPPPPELASGTVDEFMTNNGFLLQDMGLFWQGYRPHFAAFGINLCSLTLSHNFWVLRPSAELATDPHPFAFYCDHKGLDGLDMEDTRLRAFMCRFGYAQDASGRDLVIKLTDKGSMEYNIYRSLGECNSLYDGREFQGVLPPTAILDSPYQFAFVVMPMWGVNIRIDHFDTLGQVTTFIRYTLSGLAHLHRHRIAHRDIEVSNMVVNRYCSLWETDVCVQRLREHHRSPAVAYALFEFDLSLQIPPETPLKSCRRPAEEAFTGKHIYHPADVYEGERHYNPFAFDVACLGRLYLAWFKDVIPVVPLLAPLIGKMRTHIIEERWSAEEALNFFNEILAGLSPDVLDSSVTSQFDANPLDDPNLYWNELGPEFQRRWKTHRPPPLSWASRILRWMNTTDIGWAIVPRVRRYLSI